MDPRVVKSLYRAVCRKTRHFAELLNKRMPQQTPIGPQQELVRLLHQFHLSVRPTHRLLVSAFDFKMADTWEQPQPQKQIISSAILRNVVTKAFRRSESFSPSEILLAQSDAFSVLRILSQRICSLENFPTSTRSKAETKRFEVAVESFPFEKTQTAASEHMTAHQGSGGGADHIFVYRIKLTNRHPKRTYQLIARKWKIFDGDGNPVGEVQGEGVVGRSPILKPGETHVYQSFCPLNTPTGYMTGQFRVKNVKTSKEFDAQVAPFLLSELEDDQTNDGESDTESDGESSLAVFHAGQCIRHKRYGYHGVIFRADSTCKQSEAWIESMNVDSLERGRNQAFYRVLVHSGDVVGGADETYVAEDNIDVFQPDSESAVDHPAIGHIFGSFDAARHEFVPRTDGNHNPSSRVS